jgi:uncharacterized membrane protein
VIEQTLELLKQAALAISLFSVAVIIVGFAVAAWRYARRFKETTQENNFDLFKAELGGALMLALEILVLAEVIKTITGTSTFSSLAILLAVMVIRTAVSWNLTLSSKGYWPWQVRAEDQGGA